jgi:LacI family transcriptional regulator
MPVRMKDIARDLGVSAITVSKVLRNVGEIGEETRRRILNRVKELDYQPNPAARSLATGRTFMMGLVVPDLVHPFFAQVAKGASRVLREQNYGLVISSSEQDPDLEKNEIRQMLARRLDVLLIASAQCRVESFRRIEQQQKQYVLIDRKFGGLAAHFVGTDDLALGRIATEHLIETGCRRIAHLGGRDISTAMGRLQGYREALADRGLSVRPEYIHSRAHTDNDADAMGYEGMKILLELNPRPDGVFCYNDPMAMGAMEAVLEIGLRIPEDIAIIGCGNVKYARMLRVPLSSVDQNSQALGEQAAKLALEIATTKKSVRPKTILLPPSLIARESTMRKPTVGLNRERCGAIAWSEDFLRSANHLRQT